MGARFDQVDWRFSEERKLTDSRIASQICLSEMRQEARVYRCVLIGLGLTTNVLTAIVAGRVFGFY